MERLTEKLEDHYITRYERVNGRIIGNQMCLDKLGELEDAEEQGLLLRLPCKVGDTVYVAVKVNGEVEEMVVRSIEIYPGICKGVRFWCTRKKYAGDWFFFAEDYGETVFSTYEEAEAALAEEGDAE